LSTRAERVTYGLRATGVVLGSVGGGTATLTNNGSIGCPSPPSPSSGVTVIAVTTTADVVHGKIGKTCAYLDNNIVSAILDSEQFRSTPRTCGRFRCNLSLR
jgi:mannitol-specific phosphotransferase system IIBC component